MRRTLALAGAAVLAVGVSALPAPAAADPIVSDVFINEVGAELSKLAVGVEGGFVELKNTTGSSFSLDAYQLLSCNPNGNPEVAVDFDNNDSIPAGGTFLIADPMFDSIFSPTPDQLFDSEIDALLQSEGGVALVNGETVKDSVEWGSPPSTCTYPAAGEVLDDDSSINRASETEWDLAAPTPTGSTD
jgi:hypothetical protein